MADLEAVEARTCSLLERDRCDDVAGDVPPDVAPGSEWDYGA